MIKDYEIIKQIGSGGMGAVYLARDPRLDRSVAIKKIKIGLNVEKDVHNEILQRFYREAKAIASISHHNIVTIYELGEDDETREAFMVMEYLEGKSLEVLLLENSLSEDIIIKIIIQTCDALSYIHKKNIIHRDIKPGNLIFCDNGLLKLTDFGLVRLEDNLDITRSGTLLGSALYMAPEQIENPKNIDTRVDIYSLGVTAFQLLSRGNFPYNGENVWELIKVILTTNATNISKFIPTIDKKLEDIIMKSISKNISDRYQDILDFKSDLMEYYSQNNQPIVDTVNYINNNNTENKISNPRIKNSLDELTKTEIITDFNEKEEYTEEYKTIDINNITDDIENNLKSSINYLSSLYKASSKQINILDNNIIFSFNIKDKLILSIKEILDEINKMVKEYNSFVASRNYTSIDMNELKRKIDLKKSILSGRRKEEEFINKKIDIYNKFKDLNKSKNTLINILINILNTDTLFISNSVFDIKDNEIDNLKNNIKEKINNYFNLINYREILSNNILNINNIFNLCEYSEPIASVIRTVHNSNSIEVKLTDNLENNVLLEIDDNNNNIIFANCLLYEDGKQVHKSRIGNIVILKSEEFTEETKNKIKINNKIYKYKQRLLDKAFIEEERAFIDKLNNKLDIFINYYLNKLNTLFDKFEIMFLLDEDIDFSPETKQFTIVKINKIKKALLELKKEFEADINIEFFLQKINNIILSINKFPINLRNIENNIRIKKDKRKRSIQSFFIQINKFNAKEINNQFDNINFNIERLRENDIPSSIISFIIYFTKSKAGIPTEKSKNEIVNELNSEKNLLSSFEIDTVCRVFNLKYNNEKGFVIKIGL